MCIIHFLYFTFTFLNCYFYPKDLCLNLLILFRFFDFVFNHVYRLNISNHQFYLIHHFSSLNFVYLNNSFYSFIY